MFTLLSVRLREGTKDAHRLAENAPFIREFFSGQLSQESYREFLVQLYSIYSALEEHQDRYRMHAVFGKIYFPALYRTHALEQDLNFYYGNVNWRALPLHEATSDYVNRMHDLSNEWVEGLVAHHYTRYLGDLSGGQMLKRMVAKIFKLSSGD
ncbi:MAG: biliverdin-producing heme oxygenase, partial [Chloroflexi bacterium]|nr:biliverdin-producing heme oxygenase [Chloroflexota bacterium]